MSAPFKQLLEGATPGPWIHEDRIGGKPNNPSEWGRSGLWGANNHLILGSGGGWDAGYEPPEECDAQLIARCNPATMRAVLEALEHSQNALKDYIPDLEARGGRMNYGRSVLEMIESALAALNGETP